MPITIKDITYTREYWGKKLNEARTKKYMLFYVVKDLIQHLMAIQTDRVILIDKVTTLESSKASMETRITELESKVTAEVK